LYLHTGEPLDGIAHPLVWKASPNKTEVAIISKCNSNERTLKQVYFENIPDEGYSPPSTSEVCSLGIKLVELIDQIHCKKVRHGNLRPDVIGYWLSAENDPQLCLRDFTQSSLLGDQDSPATNNTTSAQVAPEIYPSPCLHYMAPELFSEGKTCTLLVPGSLTTQWITGLTITPSEP
jgi:hypothetical protein